MFVIEAFVDEVTKTIYLSEKGNTHSLPTLGIATYPSPLPQSTLMIWLDHLLMMKGLPTEGWNIVYEADALPETNQTSPDPNPQE